MNFRVIALGAASGLAGVGIATAALYSAVSCLGPGARYILGEPHGLWADYATPEAWIHATVLRTLSLAMFFFAFGFLALRLRGSLGTFTWSFLVANPITVGAGYLIYQDLWSGEFPGVYFGFFGCVLISKFSVVFGFCVAAGVRIRRLMDRESKAQ